MSDVVVLTPQQQLHDRRAAAFSSKRSDPRAAPASFRTNVSVSESCEFYGLADSISGCRVPRSCQDCLTTPGCGLASSGQCLNVTVDAEYFSGDFDYRNASFQGDSAMANSSSFFFIAESATYCAASDPVCSKCRADFQQIAVANTEDSSRYVGTQFCKGDNGCVCIGVCEVPRQRAFRVDNPACNQPYVALSYRPRISRGVQQRRSEPRSPVVKAVYTSKKGETCAYLSDADLRGCRRPRTCRDCLHKPGCMLRNAKCAEDGWGQDFRKATLDQHNRSVSSGSLTYRFPSSSTTYCSASDSTCASCRRDFPDRSNSDWSSVLSRAYFCVGLDGCVCIEACESDQWTLGVYDEECLQLEKRVDAASPTTSLAIAVAVWVVLWTVYKLSTYKAPLSDQEGRAQRGPGLRRQMLDEVPALARLDLFGWRAHQEELYYREQELLHGLEITAVRPPVDFDDMDPSAPDFDEDDASAPTTHDPKALASAPIYRGSFVDESSSASTDHSSPSAPDFDLEELDAALSPSGRLGLVSRRVSRREV